ncbi:hypothetical protein [Comamonas fluminis]|uniref:hypothetical protein n=1 Tax=Comamonas fluminis TaxID=2796366 RepID=UPI001C4507F3|nr:hypothetical protein [Comamonas fluminis]
MKKSLTLIGISAIAMAILGCSSSPRAHNIGGNYFMVGDENCKKWSVVSSQQIVCYTSEEEVTSSRYAMTPQDIQSYGANAASQSQQMSNLGAQLNDMGRSLNQQSQGMLQQSSGHSAPISNSIQQPKKYISCYTTSGITTCR